MIVELLKPAGPDLARRWLAALLLAPHDERESIVESVEERLAELYPATDSPMFTLRGEEVQRDGYTERIDRTYEAAEPAKKPKPRGRKKGA